MWRESFAAQINMTNFASTINKHLRNETKNNFTIRIIHNDLA